MDRLKMQTENIVDENIDFIGKKFPNCIVEAKDASGKITKMVDFDLLKQELSEVVIDTGSERYTVSWPGKKASMLEANSPIAKCVRPLKNESIEFEKSQNIYIKGDNIESLKLLRETYLGKIKMIYIDPPYNTGNDTLPYSDDFSMSTTNYLEQSMQQVAGIKMVTNTTDNGKFHTDWLNVLYPRLKIAKDLLTDDGVIFISIDDNEAGNMKSICDEIFGSKNYLETFFIQVRYGEKSLNEKDNFQKLIEQVFIYAKDKTQFVPQKPYEDYDLSTFCWQIEELEQGEEMVLGGKKVWLFKPGQYQIKQVEASIDNLKETWASGSVLKGNTSGKFFDKQLSERVSVDGYGCLYKVEGIGEDGIGYRYFTGPKKAGATKGKFYSGVPLVRREELKTGSSRKYKPIINYYDYSGDFGNISHEGKVTFRGGKKPIKMLLNFMEIANLKDGDIVLDFFSGSASTAHATIEYNKTHDNKIKYILMQIQEEFDENSDYHRSGFKNICDLAIKRLHNIYEEDEGFLDVNIDKGVRVFEVDTSNMKDTYYKPADYSLNLLDQLDENIKPDRTPEDLLFQVMLDLGLMLDSKIEEKNINGKKVFVVGEYNDYVSPDLICCFDANVDNNTVTEIAKMKPRFSVFRDSSMSRDSVAVNFDQIFETYSPSTTRKVL